MRKKLIEQLYNGSNLADGFDSVLKTIKEDQEDKWNKLNSAEELAHIEIEQEFEKKRNALKNQETNISKELKKHLKMVERYSTFKLDCNDFDIIDILVDITSLYMGEEYDFDEVEINSYDQIIIRPTSLKISMLSADEIYELIENGTILSLVGDQLEDEINFYEAYKSGTIHDSQPMQLRISDNSEKHKFILEFIDLVVRYRMLKKCDEISYVELKKIEQVFIFNKKAEIEEIHRKKTIKEREELEQSIAYREAMMNNYCNENLNNIETFEKVEDTDKVSSGRILRKLIETYNETFED